MKVVFVVVGKAKERALRELLGDYAGRIKRYAKVEEVELDDGGEAEVAARIAKRVPERAALVALEVDGQRFGSEALARFVERCEVGSVPAIVFVIGGSYGLPKSTSASADLRLSLSDMTLPHRLARLVLYEQVYRAFTILRNEPYSH